ncbi:MAG: amino acid ABC transporter permease, partial [Deltaproteobacteria bacterium]|nr:amino acid ABC transporter permease [Deltaproteobacteria bacterium]
SLPYILGGVLVTIAVVTLSLALGLALGVPLALLQVYGPAGPRFCVSLYVWFFRGIPILVLLFMLYFGIFWPVFGMSAFSSSCIILGMTSAAYQSQIFRGAVEALPHGQLRAARALGMGGLQGICFIVMPQALRLALPGWSNEFSILLKDSALIYLLGAADLMARITQVADRTFMQFTYSILAGALYLIITVAGLKLLRRLESRLAVPGFHQN